MAAKLHHRRASIGEFTYIWFVFNSKKLQFAPSLSQIYLDHNFFTFVFPSSSLSGSASENTLSRVRCNSHSSSSQTPSPKMHNSPSFTFGCPPSRSHAQNNSTHAGGRGGNKTLGPVRGKLISQPSACVAGWHFLSALHGCTSALFVFSSLILGTILSLCCWGC